MEMCFKTGIMMKGFIFEMNICILLENLHLWGFKIEVTVVTVHTKTHKGLKIKHADHTRNPIASKLTYTQCPTVHCDRSVPKPVWRCLNPDVCRDQRESSGLTW